MKRTTILIYKDSTDPKKGLKEATQEEWSAILKSNKGLPMCERRCFIEDSFEDCGVIDRMFIEVTLGAYKEWDRERKRQSRNEEQRSSYQHISLDYQGGDDDSRSFDEFIASGFDLEGDVLSRNDIEAFHQALAKWRPWAMEMLENYLSGERRCCTQKLCEKYGVSAVVIRKRKRDFEKFARKFFEDRGFVLKE